MEGGKEFLLLKRLHRVEAAHCLGASSCLGVPGYAPRLHFLSCCLLMCPLAGLDGEEWRWFENYHWEFQLLALAWQP